jgi:DNA-binding NarL/FixJ family response regulator
MTDSSLSAPKPRILLVEDHPVTREGLARLLDFEGDLQVCGQCATAAEALQGAETLKPDLVIADISLVGRSGLELIKDLSYRCPSVAVLVLSTHDETVYAERALAAGAKGYVMKSEPIQRILAAIHEVLEGKLCLSERMKQRLLGRFTRHRPVPEPSDLGVLSDRELEVFRLLGQGRSTAQIAASLHMSPSTVATHRRHIQQKLNVNSLAELLCVAAQWIHSQAA